MKALLFLIAILPSHAQLLGAFETFSQEDNADSWGLYDFADGNTYLPFWTIPGSTNPEIYGSFIQDYGISLFADALSSQGAFVGDYTAEGIDTVSSEIYIEDPTSLGAIELYILSNGTFYYSEDFNTDEPGWFVLNSSLSQDQWFIFNATTQEFELTELTPAILSTVDEVGFNFYPTSIAADGQIVAIDNFTILPDLSPTTLSITNDGADATLAFTGISGLEYTLETSSDLASSIWTTVETPFEISGLSETQVPLDGKAFFRVFSQPLFLEVQ